MRRCGLVKVELVKCDWEFALRLVRGACMRECLLLWCVRMCVLCC